MAANPKVIDCPPGTERVRRHPDQAVEALDPLEAAKLARLHHSLADRPGSRVMRPAAVDYRRPEGSLVPMSGSCGAFSRSVIPPAWIDVWINPDPLGHIQATGQDQRGRKQYRYHPRWREVRANPNPTK